MGIWKGKLLREDFFVVVACFLFCIFLAGLTIYVFQVIKDFAIDI